MTSLCRIELTPSWSRRAAEDERLHALALRAANARAVLRDRRRLTLALGAVTLAALAALAWAVIGG